MYVFNDSVAAYRLTDSYNNCAYKSNQTNTVKSTMTALSCDAATLSHCFSLLLLSPAGCVSYPQPGYSGSLLNFSLNVGWYKSTSFAETPQYNHEPTGQLSISFAILPPPEVDWFSVDQCDEMLITGSAGDNGNNSNSYYAYTSCNVSGQGMGMTGRYLYASVSVGNATVGWFQAPIISDTVSSNDVLSTSLPLTPRLAPNILYDVRVVNDGGELILPRRLSYSRFPLIAAIEQCSNRGVAQQLGCGPGDVITIRGAQFPESPHIIATVTISSTDIDSGEEEHLSANCTSVNVLDRSTLTCVLPTLATESDTETLLGSASLVQASFHTADDSSTNSVMTDAVLTNALYVDYLFMTPGFPYVTTVRGCGQQLGLRSLAQCQSGDVITVQGAHLDLNIELGGVSALSASPFVNANGQNGPASFNMVCLLFANTSSSSGVEQQLSPSWLRSVQCQLPKFDVSDAADGGMVQEGVTYHFYIAHSAEVSTVDGGNVTVYYPLTSAFDVVFSSTNTSPALSSGGLVGVVIGTLAAIVAAALIIVLLLRRWRVKKEQRGRNGAAVDAGDASSSHGGVWRRSTQHVSQAYTEMELEAADRTSGHQ